MTENKQFNQPKKLNVDENKRYHIELPNGKSKIIQLNKKEIKTVENWFQLIGKHPLRANIVNILHIYTELNITQISKKVEQSKPTVGRHLKAMEQDGLLVSRSAGTFNQGKIPPKLYKLNNKILEVLENCPVQPPEPNKPEELIKFYQREIDGHRAIIHRYKFMFDLLISLFDMFESQLGDVAAAKEIWKNYFDEDYTNTFPSLGYYYFSEKYFKKFDEAYKVFTQTLLDLLTIQNSDPDVKSKEFMGINAILPIRALFDIYKK